MATYQAFNGSYQSNRPEQLTPAPQDGAVEVMRTRLQALDIAAMGIETGVAAIEARLAQRVPLQSEVAYVPTTQEAETSIPSSNPLFPQGADMAAEARQIINEIDDFGVAA